MKNRLLWALGGMVFTVILWRLIVPWDLSEIDAEGRAIRGGGDDSWPLIAAVLAMILLSGALVGYIRSGPIAVNFTFAAAAVWVGLFAWRSSAARVAGANLWPVSFVMFILPGAALVVWVVAQIARWRQAPARGRAVGNVRHRHYRSENS